MSIGISTDLRYLICEKHIAFYSIDGNVISIAQFFDGRQDYLRILFSNTDEYGHPPFSCLFVFFYI